MLASRGAYVASFGITCCVALGGAGLIFGSCFDPELREGMACTPDEGLCPGHLDCVQGTCVAHDASGIIESDSSDPGGLDAGPGAPAISEVVPEVVFEGAGSSGAAIPVVIWGEGLAEDLELSSDSELVTFGSVVVSKDGRLAAAPLRVAVDSNLERGATESVELVLSQAEGSASASLEVEGLNELALGGRVEVEESTFDDLYSTIALQEDAELVGDHPARLRSTGTIFVGQTLSAQGGLGETRAPGAGGCRGGAVELEGDCQGGGGGGLGGDGGGGAGHAETGSSGAGLAGGSAGGSGGEKTGNVMLVPLGGEGGARGSGGGGGSDSETSGALGGGGGGGGGVIELSSWGDIEVSARITVGGGPGGSAGSQSCAGGGGGGAGGAVLLRAGGSLAASGGAELVAPAGVGGILACENDGGEGAPGRLRIDATSSTLPEGLDVEPTATRGPMWRGEPPTIARSSPHTIEFVADPRYTYELTLDGELQDSESPSSEGTGELTADLEPGLQELCLVLPEEFAQDRPESRNCRHLAYIP